MVNSPNYITNDVKALIGVESGPIVACDVVERGAVRRFTQAIMDDDPIYWDAQCPAIARYGGVVAPPLFPLHAFRRGPGTPDPLDESKVNPAFDGAGHDVGFGLPAVPIPLKRLLNGGNNVEVRALAHLGDQITAVARYRDIYQKEGKQGPLVFVVIEAEYKNQDEMVLLVSRETLIWR